MKERIAKLLAVKSIISVVLTGGFIYLSVIGEINGADFLKVFLMVISFYYGTQAKKD